MPDLLITLNGQPRNIPGPATLDDLLRELGLDARTVVVEHNRRIVRRPRLGETALAAGDAVELVHFVGGG
jgi:thiamine biosynthesis protein ThiS